MAPTAYAAFIIGGKTIDGEKPLYADRCCMNGNDEISV